MGRKKVDDPIVRVDVWVTNSTVINNGGKEQAQEKAKKYLEQESKKTLKT